ncbi:hypothetical protein KUTeg_016206 [Tegillarca granosa]|uniref:Uncharacterized protein n=1 Tax=Tegillarca granosa TaxID=220873 RepID=A0ABQ9EK76_TEGGR|nr:hypothetical protein KUTeg_016206 [Tegillarca granosa]
MTSKPEELWCHECGKSVPGLCKKHGGFHQVVDNVIPTYARLTLPPGLTIKQVKLPDGTTKTGVFAKKIVQCRSQFGPLIAPVKSREKAPVKVEPRDDRASPAINNNQNNVLESVSQSDVTIQPIPQDSSVSLLNNSNITGQQFNAISSGQVIGPYGDGIMTSQALQNGYPQTVALTVSQDRIVNSDLTGVISHIPVNNEIPVTSINSDIPVTAEHFNSEQIVADLALQASLVAGITSADAITTESIQNTTMDMIENQYQQHQQVTLAPQSVVDCNMTPQGDATNTTLVQTSSTENAVISETVSTMTSVTENNSTSNTTSQSETTEDPPPPTVDEKFELKIYTDDGYVETLDLQDEMKCSWMMFVRPAANANEQNLVVYQFQKQLYFVSIKPIPSNTELRVWYSADYAKMMDKNMLPEINSADQQTAAVCYDGFGAFADLEAHVCTGVALGSKRLRGRPRKGRPRKYIKPTKSWRARLEKTRLIKPSSKIVDPSMPPRKRGRPPKIKQQPVELEVVEKPAEVLVEDSVEEFSDVIREDANAITDAETVTSVSEYIDDAEFIDDEDYIPVVQPKRRGRKKRLVGPKFHRTSKREPMQCPHCEEKFTKEASYVVHVSEHTGIKPYICEVPECAKGFMSKFKLERHRLIHTCPRHHKCPYCDKSFNRKDHLKNHLITHDPNKKRWVCEECGKEYSYNFSYRTHKAFHDAEAGRTTECGICHKNCENRDALLYHLKVHSGARSVKNCTEKTHACGECGKKFYTRKDVRRHMITHTKRKDFLCQYCPQRFGRKDHLTRHLRSSHSGDNPNAKPPRAPRGDRKEKEKRAAYEHLMAPSAALTIPREDPAVLADYRTMPHVVQGHTGTMYLSQPQQHHTMMKQDPTNLEQLTRTNGVLPNEYQTRVDQTGRPTVLQASESRQAPAQTFSTLLGYMETLRFLENLPTNAQGVIAQMEGNHPPTMVPLNTTPYSTTAANVTGIPNTVEIQKRMPVTHHNAYQQGS